MNACGKPSVLFSETQLMLSDGENALSYTLWVYEPSNTHTYGDGWNGEDLSLFSYDDIPSDLDLVADDPPDLKSLITLGARGIDGWSRPYPAEVIGRTKSFEFDMSSAKFTLTIEVVSLESSRSLHPDGQAVQGGEVAGPEASALIYVPFAHYLASGKYRPEKKEKRLMGNPSKEGDWEKGKVQAAVDLEIEAISEGRLEVEGQWMRWYYPLRKQGDREISLTFRRWSG